MASWLAMKTDAPVLECQCPEIMFIGEEISRDPGQYLYGLEILIAKVRWKFMPIEVTETCHQAKV